MSASDYVSSILGVVVSNIGSLSSEASKLIENANNALEDDVTFPEPGVVINQSWEYQPKYTLANRVDGLPDISGLTKPPEPPKYGSGVAPPPGYESDADIDPPGTFFPSIPQTPEPVAPPPKFEYDPSLLGSESSSTTTPQHPDITPGFSLNLLSINQSLVSNLTINLPPITFIPVDVKLPPFNIEEDTTQFKSFVFNGASGIPGINELSIEADKFPDAVITVLSGQVYGVIADRLINSYTTINQNKETLLQSFFVSKQTLIEQQQDLALNSIIHRSGWILPQAIQHALYSQSKQLMDSWIEHAGMERRTQQMEHAQKLLEVCVDVYGKLREAVEQFRNKEVEMILSAHRDSIQYSQTRVKILNKIFDIDNYRKYDLELKKFDALLKQFEMQLQIDSTRYEFVKSQIELEKFKQEQDGLLVKQYSAEADVLKVNIGIVKQQIEAVKQEIKFKEFPIKKFQAKIDVFSTQVNAEEANLKNLLSRIEGNDLAVQQELMKIKAYETEIKGSEEYTSASSGKTDAQSAKNRAMMSAYEGTAKAAVLPVEYSLLNAKYDLYTHQINAENFLSDGQLSIKIKESDFEFMKQKRELRDELLRDMKEMTLDIAETEIDRKKAIADVSIQCANVIASMAEGAMSAGNLVASTVLQEFS